MGHTLSPKSKFYLFNYSDEAVTPEPIVVRGPDWSPVEIEFTVSDSFKYLGVHLSRLGSMTHQVDMLVNMGRKAATYMANRGASLESKMVVLTRTVVLFYLNLFECFFR